MPKKMCNQIGCSNIIGFDQRYCSEHNQFNSKKEQTKYYDANKRDASRNKFYQSAQWKRLRKLHLSREPLCSICPSVGEVVDHIEEIKDGGCATCLDNLQTLCNACHNIKTKRAAKRRNK